MNKLVRDKIDTLYPPIDNDTITRSYQVIGNSTSRINLLVNKLFEECVELSQSSTKNEALQEMVDIHSIIDQLRREYEITTKEFNAAVRDKIETRGGFVRCLIMISSDGNY